MANEHNYILDNITGGPYPAARELRQVTGTGCSRGGMHESAAVALFHCARRRAAFQARGRASEYHAVTVDLGDPGTGARTGWAAVPSHAAAGRADRGWRCISQWRPRSPRPEARQ